MKSAWFSVVCEVKNGLTTNKISRVVYAPTASSAKYMAKNEFAGDNRVKILDAYKIAGAQIFAGGQSKE